MNVMMMIRVAIVVKSISSLQMLSVDSNSIFIRIEEQDVLRTEVYET